MTWTEYLSLNFDTLLEQLGTHTWLALVPIVLGLVIALPIGYLATRYRKIYPPLLALSSILYSIPSLALFVILPGILGTRILSPINIVVALTLYTIALLIRTVVDGLSSVSEETKQAATALGYRRTRRLLNVELPIAVPVILAGVRVASVSNISLVSIGALLGTGGLGQLFTDGFQRDFLIPIIFGIVLSVLLAIVADALIVLVQRLLTPWARAGATR